MFVYPIFPLHQVISIVAPCRMSDIADTFLQHPTGGGKPISQNRTLWPVTGGAVGIQPGWFRGHASAFMYVNLGDGTVPENYSLIMQPVFEIIGPNNDFYNGSICLPHVPLPANYTAVVGNNATIQVVEAAQHGAALYNVSCPCSRHPSSRSPPDPIRATT